MCQHLTMACTQVIGCDFLVSATGTVPSLAFATEPFERDPADPVSGALVVDRQMRTSCRDVFAAGDCCCYVPAPRRWWARRATDRPGDYNCDEDEEEEEEGECSESKPWFQMRLWTQVWCGVVSCGVAWRGVAWCGPRCGVVLRGVDPGVVFSCAVCERNIVSQRVTAW